MCRVRGVSRVVSEFTAHTRETRPHVMSCVSSRWILISIFSKAGSHKYIGGTVPPQSEQCPGLFQLPRLVCTRLFTLVV